MSLLATLDEFDARGQVGDWCFTTDETYIILRVHAGEMDGVCALPLKRDPADRGGNHPVWSWNGDREAPTLEPSILHHSEPPWHGFLRAGKLVLA